MNDSRNKIRNQRCVACGKCGPSDPAHIKTKGAGAGNEEWEIMPLCREHHVLQHKIGWKTMCEKFPSILDELDSKGWYFNKMFNKWQNERKL